MRRLGLALILLAASLRAASDAELEQRLVAALKADFEAGKAARTAKLVADIARLQLSEAILEGIHARQRRERGRLVGVERLDATPFRLGKPVLYRIQHERGANLVTIVLDPEGRIIGYWIKPAPPDWSWAETDRRIREWKGRTGYDCAVFDAAGALIRRRASPAPPAGRALFPLGSVFKIYILAELARQLEQGVVELDQKVRIEERLKSLPSGLLQTKPEGTEVSVREMAKGMIAISDNTATDHLLHLVGRENVEAGLKRWHNSAPERNTPFLSTREMFLIKGGGREKEVLGVDFGGLLDRYAAADVAQRRELIGKLCAPWAGRSLAQLLAPIGFGYKLRSMNQPRHVELEWFARPADITALLLDAYFRRLEGWKYFLNFYATGAEIYPRAGLKYYGFKGGSETNVFALSALAVRRDGRVVAVCVCRVGDLGANHASETVEATAAMIRLALTSG